MPNRLKPPFYGAKGKKKVVKRVSGAAQPLGPTLSRLTVLWVDQNGVPFNTIGFNAALYRGTTLVQTAFFDRFGVVYFSRVETLTAAAYTVQLYDNSGVVYRTKEIPAGVEAFAVIG